MELIPDLQIGWLNGWLPIVILYIVYSIVLIILPKEVVDRLYDRSGRTPRDRLLIRFGSIFAFAYFGLILFTPLKIGSAVFLIGMVVYLLGLTGFIVGLVNFKDAPLDRPATNGLYRFSRNPQQIMFFTVFIGVSIAVGSWVALVLQLIFSIFLHTRILAEERGCLERYGESYRSYMQRVPRYFWFF